VQLGPCQGDVIDIRIFQLTLLEIGNWVDADESTGRVIHVPNGRIFQEAQTNYSNAFEYLWNEIPILVPFEIFSFLGIATLLSSLL
jgi:small-conductance mechanosensitive channel